MQLSHHQRAVNVEEAEKKWEISLGEKWCVIVVTFELFTF